MLSRLPGGLRKYVNEVRKGVEMPVKVFGCSMDSELLAWLDAWKGREPRSKVLSGLVQILREHTEAMAEALARPELDLSYLAEEAMRHVRAGEDVPADEVLALMEAYARRVGR